MVRSNTQDIQWFLDHPDAIHHFRAPEPDEDCTLVLVERRRVTPATPDGYGLAWRIARLKAEPDLAAYAIEQGEACILEVHWNSRGAVQIQLPGGKRATLQ